MIFYNTDESPEELLKIEMEDITGIVLEIIVDYLNHKVIIYIYIK